MGIIALDSPAMDIDVIMEIPITIVSPDVPIHQ